MAITRGCGQRVAGALYLVTRTSPNGSPLEYFLIDPPIIINPNDFGVTPLGVSIHEWHGVYHVFDWVGSEHYPNAASFLEETRRYGASRHITSGQSLPLELLTEQSRLILIHSRAGLLAPGPYNSDRPIYQEKVGLSLPFKQPYCPQKRADHQQGDVTTRCIGLLWEDIEQSDAVDAANDPALSSRAVFVREPSFEYRAALRPSDTGGKYSPAIFASLPISGLEYVKSNQAAHIERLEQLRKRKISLPFMEVDE